MTTEKKIVLSDDGRARHMTGRVNWSRRSNRDRMRRQGVEDVKGKMPFVSPPQKARRRLSKAELREQAAAALLAWRERETTKDK